MALLIAILQVSPSLVVSISTATTKSYMTKHTHYFWYLLCQGSINDATPMIILDF